MESGTGEETAAAAVDDAQQQEEFECRVLFYNCQKERNVGAMCRSAVAMGVREVVVSGSPKLQVFGNQGTTRYLRFARFLKLRESVAYLKKERFQLVGVEIHPDAQPIESHRAFSPRTCFVFGNEAVGLTDKVLQQCDALCYIRQFSGGTASLNLSVACGIALHEWTVYASRACPGWASEWKRLGSKYVERDLNAQLFVGCYTSEKGWVSGKGRGAQLVSFDHKAGTFEARATVECDNPSFVLFEPRTRVLLAAIEESEGRVLSMRVDEWGGLKRVSEVGSGGGGPCYLSFVKPDLVLVANYEGGTFSTLRMAPNGELGDGPLSTWSPPRDANFPGAVPERQDAPHPHCFVSSRVDSLFAVGADLGSNTLFGFIVDAESGALRKTLEHRMEEPKFGPRHIAFNLQVPTILYVIGELNNTVAVVEFGRARGFKELQMVSLEVESGWASDIRIHPENRFAYVSCRDGEASTIALLEIEPKTGLLTLKKHFPAPDTPRSIVIHKLGLKLLAAGQNSHDIWMYSIERDTGELQKIGEYQTKSPACVQLFR